MVVQEGLNWGQPDLGVDTRRHSTSSEGLLQYIVLQNGDIIYFQFQQTARSIINSKWKVAKNMVWQACFRYCICAGFYKSIYRNQSINLNQHNCLGLRNHSWIEELLTWNSSICWQNTFSRYSHSLPQQMELPCCLGVNVQIKVFSPHSRTSFKPHHHTVCSRHHYWMQLRLLPLPVNRI